MRTAAARERLWHELAFLFCDDDGSIPEIRLTGLSASGAARIFDVLRERAHPLEPDQTVWDDRSGEDVPVAALDDAGARAALGELATLRVLLSGIGRHGTPLPDLGVSVWPETVALDYRMGPAWDAETLAAFVDLIDELCRLDEGARLVAAAEIYPLPEPVQRTFRQAIAAYLSPDSR